MLITETTTQSRRERREAAAKQARAAKLTARTGGVAALALTAPGLLAASPAVADTAESADDARASQAIDLAVDTERASQVESTSVVATPSAELSFERPFVTSESAAGPEPEPEQPAAQPQAQTQTQQSAPSEQAQTGQSAQTGQAQQGGQADYGQGDSLAASSQTAEPAQPAANGGGIISAAYAAIGTPYVWAGSSLSGMDCSGFVNWAYNQAGRGGLPRTTGGLLAGLPRVSTPQPGDIIISNGGGHAEIYIGNGQAISSTTNGGGVHQHSAGYGGIVAYLRPGG